MPETLVDPLASFTGTPATPTDALELEVRRRQRAEERLEAELADAKLLQGVSAALISEKNIGNLHEKLVDAAVGIMRSDFASMQMFYDDKGPKGALRLLASRGFNLEAQRCWEWVSHETASSCGEVLRSGKRVIATDVEQCEFLIRMGGLAAYLGAGIHAMQSTPLISRGGKLVGMISTHWKRPHEPSERDLRLFDLLARQAADLLERTQAEERLRQSEERLAADLEAMTRLYELGNLCAQSGRSRSQCLAAVLEAAIELSGADKGNLQLVDEPTGTLEIEAQRGFGPAFLEFFGRVRHDSASACGAALNSGTRVVVEDIATNPHFAGQQSLLVLLAEGVRAVQSTPLISSSGRVQGIISTHFARVHRPSERELRMLDLLARQAGDYLQRIEADRKHRDSEGRLAAIVEHSSDAILSIDLDGTILSWNQGAELLYGYPPGEAVGRPVSMLIPEKREDEEPEILARIGRSQTVQHYETVRRRKDGTLVDVSLTVSPLKDPAGRVVGASKVARDITERVRAREVLERTVAERTTQLRETVSELEAFSYSIAHDMRAPLRAMNGYAQYLERDFGEKLPETGKNFLRRIAQGAGRLDRLITDVLNYSKIARGEMRLEKVDVEKLTREIVDTYPNLRESGATVLVQGPIPPLLGNTAALTQCVSNLLSNAVKFVAPGTKARVLIRGEVRGEVARYVVEDNGIGIDEEGRGRIFRLFQRLNLAAEFEGTGIGLTIVRKAVERMNGKVGVDSAPGLGSVFWIELPHAR